MTGMPMIYYGDEYSMTGGDDPDCRRGMLWDSDKQDHDMFEYYKKLIAIRKNSNALKIGELVNVITDDEKNLYAYKKVLYDEEFLIIINANEDNVKCELQVGKIDLLTNEIYKGTVKGKSGVLIRL
jgi:glycosidase